MRKPYIKICEVCEKKLYTANPYQRRHKGCKSKRIKRPIKFRHNKPHVKIRDKQICQECGYNFTQNNDRRILVHHIDGNPKNNDMKNLVTLCENCHRKIHANGLKSFDLPDYKPKKTKTYIKKTGKLFNGI